jgi:hypothetical protein
MIAVNEDCFKILFIGPGLNSYLNIEIILHKNRIVCLKSNLLLHSSDLPHT